MGDSRSPVCGSSSGLVLTNTEKQITDGIGNCKEGDLLWNVAVNNDLIAEGNHKRVDELKRTQSVVEVDANEGEVALHLASHVPYNHRTGSWGKVLGKTEYP